MDPLFPDQWLVGLWEVEVEAFLLLVLLLLRWGAVFPLGLTPLGCPLLVRDSCNHHRRLLAMTLSMD